MKRSPELDAMLTQDEVAVASTKVRRNQWLGFGFLLIVGAVAAYFVLVGTRKQSSDMLRGDEEFSTTGFRPPAFVRDKDEPSKPQQPAIINIPPPPPPQVAKSETTEFNVPPPPPPATADNPSPPGETTPAEKFPDRLKSKMIVLDTSKNDEKNGTLAGGDTDRPIVAGEDRNSKYLAAASALADRSATARQIKRIDATIVEGTMIPGILETAIVSDLPGQVRAIVSQDVYSFDGRRVLIPTGTHLIGEYQSDVVRGQKRIFVIWTRLIRDDGVTVRLNSIGADSLGRSGLTGVVDNKFRERFGAAILLSIVGGASSYLTGYGSNAAIGNSDDTARAEDIARNTIAQTFSDMANQALGDSLHIKPTINVSQGERIFVYVRQDLDFSSLYDDPVTEVLKEIRHERRNR
ncbi:MAG: type IV secretion system protein VirB10 [Rhizobiales bacterium]|nr:type IV secretion system protein VirB10 [Hyphomicrobiales bacterium]